jgi:hypothetical protein
MLQDRECIIKIVGNLTSANHSDYAAHMSNLSKMGITVLLCCTTLLHYSDVLI